MKLWLMDIIGGIRKTASILLISLVFQSCDMPSPRYLEYQGKLSTSVHIGDIKISAKRLYDSKYLYLTFDNKNHRQLGINTDSIRFRYYNETDSPQIMEAFSYKHPYAKQIRNIKDTICSISERYVRIILTISDAGDSLYLAPNDGILVEGNRIFVDTIKVFPPDQYTVIGQRMRHVATNVP